MAQISTFHPLHAVYFLQFALLTHQFHDFEIYSCDACVGNSLLPLIMFHQMNTAQFIYKWTSVLAPVFAVTNVLPRKFCTCLWHTYASFFFAIYPEIHVHLKLTKILSYNFFFLVENFSFCLKRNFINFNLSLFFVQVDILLH